MAGKKRNIFLHEVNRMSYSSEGAHNTDSFPVRSNPRQHAEHLESLLKQCLEEIPTQSKGEVLRGKEGLYLEFSGETNKELNTKSLENIRKGIRLLNIQEENDTTKATVYIPFEKTEYYLRKVDEYKKSLGGNGNPKNNDLIRSIEYVRGAKFESFWIGKKEFMPAQEAVWCEVWLRYKQNKDVVEANFKNCCKELNIACKSPKISFPERLVFLVKANEDNLVNLLRICDDIAEFRRAPEPTSFFDGLSRGEQKDWEDELLERLRIGDSKTTVCLLDTGISAEHPLIKPHIVHGGIQSVDTAWSSSDHDGHGTEMAGLLLYCDLKEKLLSMEEIFVSHKLESVKILPPRGENDPELYGAVTEQAVALAEIQNPKVNRSICMAVTAPEYTEGDGQPSSWSGALDSLAAGVDSEDRNKRLILVSAGNVLPDELAKGGYPEANGIHSVENPGQSWNALTIGAYNQDVDIQHEDFSGFVPLADVGELSPYSATSVIWGRNWPIKPEILLNGSNVATNGTDYSECPDFSLLTTGKDYSKHRFSTIWATSSATAQAAWMASQIYVEYPEIWPETVRGLMVHSARWTEKMRRQFCNDDKKMSGRRNLVRSCGYGIPNLNRAIQCMNNSVNIISEEILQPYKKKESGSYAMNEMHLYTLPWPKEVLRDLEEADAELRVTLSYFIEPSPEAVGWKDKYRYASCGLRFDVINSNETLEGLKKESMSKQEEKIKKIKAMEVVEVIDGSWERKSEMLDHFILILWN